MFQLNATFVQHIMEQAGAVVTLRDLLTKKFCANHVRFGDYWTRDKKKMSNNNQKDKRLCDGFNNEYSDDEQNIIDREQCFQQQADHLLREACRDNSVPFYLATDWQDFTQHMCDRYNTNKIIIKNISHSNEHRFLRRSKHRTFWSKCPPPSSQNATSSTLPHGKHIMDVNLKSQSGMVALYDMITDWTALVLGNTCELRKELGYGEKGIKKHHSTFVESCCYPWEFVWA
jgi:hypothetical protein